MSGLYYQRTVASKFTGPKSLDYHGRVIMLENYQRHNPKPKITVELETKLQMIWDSLPQELIDKAVMELPKQLKAHVEAKGGHFENVQ